MGRGVPGEAGIELPGNKPYRVQTLPPPMGRGARPRERRFSVRMLLLPLWLLPLGLSVSATLRLGFPLPAGSLSAAPTIEPGNFGS